MSVVLDTHVWLWLINGDARLGSNTKSRIEAEAKERGVVVSAITPWEISLLVTKGRLSLPRPIYIWLTDYLSHPGVFLHPLTVSIAVDCNDLPAEIHSDPADRILIATARELQAPLVTADRKILDYAACGHLDALNAEH